MSDNRPSVYTEGTNIIYRASSFGHCINQLILARQSYDPMPFPAGIQRAFADGNDWEDRLVRYMRRPENQSDPMTFWSLRAMQKEYDLALLPNRTIRVHIDAIGRHFSSQGIANDFGVVDYVVEYKSFGKTLMDIYHEAGLSGLPAYEMQLSIEMLATGMPGLLVIADKESTTDLDDPVVEYEVFTTPPIPKKDIIKRLLLIDKLAKSPFTEPCVDEGFCQYYKYHPAPTGLKIDPQLTSYIDRYKQLSDDIKILKREQDNVRKVLDDALTPDVPVDYRDGTFGLYSTTRESLDKEGLFEACAIANLDPTPYVSFKTSTTARFK